jgi:hypothetical protein
MPMLASQHHKIGGKKEISGVCHTVALPFTFKSILDYLFIFKNLLKEKEELSKFKYFTMQKNKYCKKIL